jgi:hypothetical protein
MQAGVKRGVTSEVVDEQFTSKKTLNDMTIDGGDNHNN